MNPYKLLAICVLSVALASCAIKVQPTNVKEVGTAPVMPATSVHDKPLAGPWKVVRFDVNKATIHSILMQNSTLWLRVSDCHGDVIDEYVPVFYKDLLINGTYKNYKDGFINKYANMASRISLRSYVKNHGTDGPQRLCGRLTGGSMPGAIISSEEFEIR